MKEQKTEIKKIVLSIEGKELVLSVERAKQLKTLLNDLFGREVVKETHHHTYPSYPHPRSYPYYWGVSNNTLLLSDTKSVANTYGATNMSTVDASNLMNLLNKETK